MAGNIVMAAGLLMFICVKSGSSELVPDGVVYTEVKKTLVQGVQGVLTCRFYRDPQAVYWTKGSSHHDASLMLLWHEGQVSGPRFNDGSCDIDENYSFIIKNVSLADAGRYYCSVSNYLGFLINNYTDVLVGDTAIEAKSQVTLQMRPFLRGEVQCTVHIRPRTVSWIKKSTTSSSDETLITFENNGTVVRRTGVGYDEGLYNITDNYSLVINVVTVHIKGIYTCNVTDFDTGITFQDGTLVIVVAQPREPFPTIVECLHDESDLAYCSIPAETALTITCQVSEYYPDINLTFLYGSKKVEILGTTERNNTDGTKNKTITTAASGSKELYTCVASNIPGTRLNRSSSALLHDKEHFNRVVLVVILILIAALALISLVTYVMWKKRHFYSSLATHGHDEQVKQVEQVKLRDAGATKKSLTPEEFQNIEERISDVLMLHCRKISDLIERKPAAQVDEIIDENRMALFDDHKMLTDWQANREGNQNSREIQNAFIALDIGCTTDYAWPSDMELKWISHHLTHESMKNVCKNLKFTCKSEDAKEEGKRFDSLRKWRNKVAHKRLEVKHTQLLSALEISDLRGLIPPLRGRYVYKVEVVDMAFQLLMHDLLPTAKVLDINVTKLISYRPAFQASHLTIGTIDLLSKLLQSTASELLAIVDKGNRRSFFCSKIGKLQYRRVATNGMLIYDMSYGELGSISAEMKKITEERSTCQERERRAPGEDCSFDESLKPYVEDETDIAHAESLLLEQLNDQKSEVEKNGQGTPNRPLVEVPKDLVDLQNVLQLTDQDIVDGLPSSHLVTITDYALFKIWKEKPRSTVFNYRAALAHELRGIKMSSLADEVVAGKYIKEQTSTEFIQNMVQGLTQDQLKSLGKILNLSRKDEEWHTNTPFDVICQTICEWVMNWTKQMNPGNVLTKAWRNLAEASPGSTSEKHRDLNDILVEHGFLDLSREIMIIEQQIK